MNDRRSVAGEVTAFVLTVIAAVVAVIGLHLSIDAHNRLESNAGRISVLQTQIAQEQERRR